MTTTRAWEFAAGGLVAMLPGAVRMPHVWKLVLSWVAAGVIVYAALTFNASTLFPGWIALLPVVASAALLWVGDLETRFSPQGISRLRPIQVVGDTSYGI